MPGRLSLSDPCRVRQARLGRGDGGLENWDELRAQAAQAHNNRTAAYLIETPMLGDYLEEALSEFGLSLEDFEESI